MLVRSIFIELLQAFSRRSVGIVAIALAGCKRQGR